MDKIWSHGNTFGFCLSFRGVSVSVRVQWAVRDACWTFDWFVKVILTLSGILWWLVFPSEVWHTLLWISLQKTRLLVCLHSFWWVNYRQETNYFEEKFSINNMDFAQRWRLYVPDNGALNTHGGKASARPVESGSKVKQVPVLDLHCISHEIPKLPRSQREKRPCSVPEWEDKYRVWNFENSPSNRQRSVL